MRDRRQFTDGHPHPRLTTSPNPLGRQGRSIAYKADHLILATTLALSLSACGGGGGGGDGDLPLSSVGDLAGCYENRATGSAGDPPATTTLEFFQSSAGLQAVDPSNPANEVPVDTEATFSGTDAAPVLDGAWQADGGVTSPAVARVVYPVTGGLRQVRTDPVSFNPAAMSSESEAVDAFHVGHDFDNPLNACIAYRLQSNGDWKMTRLGASGSDAPADFPGTPVVAFNDNTTGAHDGWLTVTGGELGRIFGGGSVGSALKSGVSDVDLLDSLPDGTAFLNIDGGLFAYDPAANVLSDLNFDFPEGFSFSAFVPFGPELAVADEEELYFTDQLVLYRTVLSSNSTEELDRPPEINLAPQFGDRLTVTRDHVIWTYQWQDSTSSDPLQAIVSIDKASGAKQTLDTLLLTDQGINPDGEEQSYLARSGDWFFYTIKDSNTGEWTAFAATPDDSISKDFPNTRWIGANINPRPGADMGNAVEDLFLLTGIEPPNGTLQTVAASNPNTTPDNLDTLPSDTRSAADSFQLDEGIGTSRLATIAAGVGGSLEQDLLFVNTQPQSFVRVTNDNNQNETPVDLF